jgi:hypothetical protein
VLAIGLTQDTIQGQFEELRNLVTNADPANVAVIGDSSALNLLIPWLEHHTCEYVQLFILE